MDQGFHGRGATENPANRFERLHYEMEPDEGARDETPAPSTIFFRDATRSIIATNESPDVGFAASINPYRGCEHGCVYCYARPSHEYLGFSAGLDFETRILIKEDAPELLRRELSSPKWVPQLLGLSGVTDPYQPIERRLKLTRGCLEVLARFRNPVAIITKNHLVTRDADLLKDLAQHQAAVVFLSITTLDPVLARHMEPRASSPSGRLAAIRELSEAGVPVGVLVAPVIPGLTDHEIPTILSAAQEAGARFAGHVLLRLPHGVADLFEKWLDRHFPEAKGRVLSRVRAVRGGRLNDPRFGIRMQGEGEIADMINQLFKLARRNLRLDGRPNLSTTAFCRPDETALRLFD
jgi:DNA repair photolyase